MVATDQPSAGRIPRSHAGARTCVGCRRRDDRSVLLRVVADRAGGQGSVLVLPDLQQRQPGRGAWLHPATECLEQAVRRRAFARALRVRAEVDLGAVIAAVRGKDEHDQEEAVANDVTENRRKRVQR